MAETVRMDSGAPVAGGPDPVGDDAVTMAGKPPAVARARARRCPTCKQAFSGEARFCPFDGDPLVDAPDYDPIADPMIGKTIDGRYEVTGVIGEGGMGTVYDVRHATLGRHFALKVLRRDMADAELTARFIQEAKAAAAIGHPNIVAVNDFGTLPVEGAGGVPYFVMERLEGITLAELLHQHTVLPPRRAAGVVLQAAAGLAAAHEAGVIHRDLKPDNVFLVRNQDREYVKLLDFGVAKMAGAGRLTKAGTVFGTPHYMSPEQAAGNAVDARADIYALGIILYECLSGRVPFEADSYMGVLTKHMFATPEPIEQAVADPRHLGALGSIVMRCLAKGADDRYATMEELVAALELFLRDPSAAATASIGSGDRMSDLRLRQAESFEGRVSLPATPVSRMWPTVLVAGALLALALAFAGWRFAGPGQGAQTAPTEARSASAPLAPSVVAATTAPASAGSVASASAGTAPGASAPAATGSSRPSSTAPQRLPSQRHPPTPGRTTTPGGDLVDPWSP